jgi:hypothetical protein
LNGTTAEGGASESERVHPELGDSVADPGKRELTALFALGNAVLISTVAIAIRRMSQRHKLW